MTDAAPGSQELSSTYDQLCTSYRAIDDFRAKLLGFLPLATGGGIFLALNTKVDLRTEFLLPVGLFGLAVTLGLFSYEIYGIRKCHALILAGTALEKDLGLKAGQFIDRPRAVFGLVNEPFAASIIYPAVIAAWGYLALALIDRLAAGTVAAVLFAAGMSFTLWYARRLAREG
jgi:hypothetical protein